MNKAIFALALVVAMLVLAALTMFAPKAHAAGFNDEPTCYSWEGGHKSSGSFTKCPSGIPAAPTKVAAAQPAPIVVPPPVMQTQVCPPQVILEPEPKKAIKRKPRPVPQKC